MFFSLYLHKDCCKNLVDFHEVHVVLGNEACDLDSMVSSLVYAFSIFKVFLISTFSYEHKLFFFLTSGKVHVLLREIKLQK